MIDYDKLKKLHQLANELSEEKGPRIDVVVGFYGDGAPDFSFVGCSRNRDAESFSSIEEVITKLQSLIQPKACQECIDNAKEFIIRTKGYPIGEWSRIANDMHALHLKNEDAQPKPKYEVGQTVAYIDEDNIPQEFMIEGMCDFSSISYWENKEDDLWHLEASLFPSKQALIEHQIEFWINELKSLPAFAKLTGQYILESEIDTQSNQDEVDLHECQHKEGPESYLTYPAALKCKKCGEFYK